MNEEDARLPIDLRDRATYPVWTRDTIRYADLDPNGHVNNGAINAYFEDGRVRLRHTHLSSVAADTLTGFVLARFAVQYHAPLHFPGDVEVGTVITRLGRTSYTLGQGLFSGDACIASAEVVTVRLDAHGVPTPLSDELKGLLQRFAAAGASG